MMRRRNNTAPHPSQYLPQVGDVASDEAIYLANNPSDDKSLTGVSERGCWITAKTAFVRVDEAPAPRRAEGGQDDSTAPTLRKRRYDLTNRYLKFECFSLMVPPIMTLTSRNLQLKEELLFIPVRVDGHRILFFLARVCGLSAFEIENVPNAFCPTGNFTVRLPSDEAERFKQLVASITLYFDLSTGMVVLTNDMPESAAWVDANCNVEVRFQKEGRKLRMSEISETSAVDCPPAYLLVRYFGVPEATTDQNDRTRRVAARTRDVSTDMQQPSLQSHRYHAAPSFFHNLWQHRYHHQVATSFFPEECWSNEGRACWHQPHLSPSPPYFGTYSTNPLPSVFVPVPRPETLQPQFTAEAGDDSDIPINAMDVLTHQSTRAMSQSADGQLMESLGGQNASLVYGRNVSSP